MTSIFNQYMDNIEQVQLLGPELVLGKIFNSIGFNAIEDDFIPALGDRTNYLSGKQAQND